MKTIRINRGKIKQPIKWGKPDNARKAEERDYALVPNIEENLLPSVLDAIQDGITVMDNHHTILMQNEITRRMNQHQDAIGKPCHQVHFGRPEPCDDCHVLEARETGRLVKKKALFQTEGPEGQTFEVYGYPIHNARGEITGTVEYLRDITHSRKIQRELEEKNVGLAKAKEEAEAANQIKSQFLANMSHELRTPLNGLMGMLQLLETTTLTEEQQEFIGIALDGSRSLTRVVEDILNYTSLERKTQNNLEVPFQLEEFLQEIMRLHQAAAAHKNLSLSVHKDHSLPNRLIGDRFKLKQVLGNLLGNAVKFTETGAVNLLVKEEKGETSPGRIRIQFQVKDTGIGIDPEKLDYIFQQFSQADESHTRKYGGLGLGLAVAREQAAVLGGMITADSIPGKGSTFTLTCEMGTCQGGLGQDQVCLDITKPTSGDIYLPNNKPEKIRVLVVDDDYASRVMAQLYLKSMGCQVDTATQGKDALEMVGRNSYHLILMDCQMPVMNGYEATRCIREREKGAGRHTPVVAMTAKVLPGDREECLEAGMDGFLAKPFDLKTLKALVRQYGIAGREAR